MFQCNMAYIALQQMVLKAEKFEYLNGQPCDNCRILVGQVNQICLEKAQWFKCLNSQLGLTIA